MPLPNEPLQDKSSCNTNFALSCLVEFSRHLGQGFVLSSYWTTKYCQQVDCHWIICSAGPAFLSWPSLPHPRMAAWSLIGNNQNGV